MRTVSIRCPEVGCAGVVQIPEALYNDSAETEITTGEITTGLSCPHGHTFDFQKGRCPRCRYPLTEGGWRKPQELTGTERQERSREFDPSTCTNPACDYEGPKEE